MDLCPYCGKKAYPNGCCIQSVRNTRDRYKEALEDIISNEEAYHRGDALSAHIAKEALRGDK